MLTQHLTVPVNLKDRDAFHLTIEEYLQSLISLIDELVCLSLKCAISSSQHLGAFGYEFSDAWRLRDASPDKSIRQRCAFRLPDPEFKKRFPAETK